jgi:hypothetical protein
MYVICTYIFVGSKGTLAGSSTAAKSRTTTESDPIVPFVPSWQKYGAPSCPGSPQILLVSPTCVVPRNVLEGNLCAGVTRFDIRLCLANLGAAEPSFLAYPLPVLRPTHLLTISLLLRRGLQGKERIKEPFLAHACLLTPGLAPPASNRHNNELTNLRIEQ